MQTLEICKALNLCLNMTVPSFPADWSRSTPCTVQGELKTGRHQSVPLGGRVAGCWEDSDVGVHALGQAALLKVPGLSRPGSNPRRYFTSSMSGLPLFEHGRWSN